MNPGSPSTPSSPYTLSNERYKANVNRTKTRKWVEAKKIDYGGDDWGADDDFEDDDADEVPTASERSQTFPQPLPQPSRTDRLAGLRAIGDGSGHSSPRSGSAGSARSMRPSERIAMERQASGGLQPQRNFTAPPALHVNTGTQAQRPVQSVVEPQESSAAQQSPYPPRKSSMDQQDKPNLTIEQTVQHPARTSSRSVSPGMQSPPSGTGSGDADAANVQRRSSFGRNDADGSRILQPLAPVAERKSEYGFDGLMINPSAAPPTQPKVSSDIATETARDPGTRQDTATSLSSEPAPPILQYPKSSDDRPAGQQPPKQYSISPKLPDFARMSGFGSDFFSGGGGFLGGSGAALPKQPEAPAEATRMPATRSTLEPGSTGVTATGDPTRHARDELTAAQTDDQAAALSNSQPPSAPRQPKPLRPSLPGTWVSETPSSGGEMATPYSEQGDRAIDPRITTIGEHPDDASLKPAPLRTPTPRDRESFSRNGDDDRLSNKSGRSSPTKGQHLRTTASRLSNVEQSDQTPTEKHDTGGSSGDQQASDVTPVAPAPLQPRKSAGDLAPQERQTVNRTDTMLTDTSSPLKESDVLRDEIIRSLSPVRGSDAHLDAHDDTGAARESAYLSDVYGDYWAGGDKRMDDEPRDLGHADALTSVKEGGSVAGTPTPPATSEPEPVKPNTRRERFSWEAGTASPVPSPTKAHPLPELPGDEPGPSSEAPQLASPIDRNATSPPVELPVLDFDRDDENTTLKGEHLPAGLFTYGALGVDDENGARQLSNDHEARTSINRNSDLFSPTTDTMTLDSPTSPDARNPYYMALDPEPMRSDSPTDIPLPHSPTEGAGADTTPPTSSGQNTMNLKQIMALPTSPERVYKLHEARAEFAATPSGLSQWITQLLAQPEHANAGAKFGYAPAGDDLPLFVNQRRPQHAAATAVGGEAVVSGPRRRSSLTLGGPGVGGGSVRIGTQAGQQLGNLMHGPAGAKGKELLQSAGKMGKGLLSKGKSKLRERAESKKG